MKNFLHFLLILLGIIVLGVVILGIVEPKNITIQRSIVIDAPKEAISEQIIKFKNWPHWSPWYQMDSTMKLTYYGEDGQLGSGFHWEGDKNKTGTGDMKNIGTKPGEIDYQIITTVPWENSSPGTFKLTDTGTGQTKLSWDITMHFSFPMNAMLMFMKMDKLLGSDFEKGLANLKKYVEANPGNTSGIVIQEVQFPGHTYEGMRSTVAWADISKFCGDIYSKVGKEAGARISGLATGLFYTWDTVGHKTDMAAVFPVSDTSKLTAGATRMHVPASGAYMAVQKGGYSNSMAYHTALGKYAVSKGHKVNLVLEEYVVTPMQEKDSSKWVTNIYYLHD